MNDHERVESIKKRISTLNDKLMQIYEIAEGMETEIMTIESIVNTDNLAGKPQEYQGGGEADLS
jgi:hypothetical protein